MHDALHRFHTIKDVLLLGRAGKKVKVKPNPLGSELMKKRNIEKETNAETWMLSKKRREMNPMWGYISYKIPVSKYLYVDLNVERIYLMSNWVEQIR